MKRFIFYFLFGFLAFFSACGMFFLKFHVMEKEITLYQMHKQIKENNRNIHVLKAEWTNLNNPERLIVLSKENTSLQALQQNKIIEWKDINLKKMRQEED